MRLRILFLSLLALWLHPVAAQEAYLTIPLGSQGKSGLLSLENYKGSIRVTAWAGNTITVAAIARTTSATPDDLPPLALDYVKEQNQVKLLYDYSSLVVDFTIQVPRNFSLKLKTVEEGDIYITGTAGDMEIENMMGDIVLQEVSGSASLSTIQGNIQALFKAIDPEKPMAFTSMEGDITLHLPKTVNASMKMKSQSGSILTDSFFDRENGKTSEVRTAYTPVSWTRGNINRGGTPILIQTYQGDIFLKGVDL